MKKISMILMAFALVMTMSQCKKNEGQPTSNDEVVTITLDVKQNNGSKVVVNPNTGTVDFETGDKIYVGSGSKYVGFLTHNGTNFVGNITNPTENQPLQFYFLGNVTPQETLSAGTTEECSVIISDQTEHLPVISCAASNENYVSGVTAYSAHLLNKCALVKFYVTTPSNAAICITGMKNKVTLDFTQNTMTPSMDGEGVIMLPAGSGENVEKWAILLPQEALEEGGEESAYLEDGTYFGIRPEIPAITENGYLAEGITMTINNAGLPIGAINGLFSVSNTKQVYFSQGNLQYQASNGIWRFAINQYDYVGYDNQYISSNYDGWIDLFGYGTSGNLVGEYTGFIVYYPWLTSTSYSSYWRNNISNTNFDWGLYNPISNGGNEDRLWRTLSKTEWEYLFVIRPNASEKYSKATVNDIHGIVILPDDYSFPEGLVFIPQSDNWDNNQYSVSEWQLMEAFGAVFLPAAGVRTGTNIAGDYSCYWSSSILYENSNSAYALVWTDPTATCYVYKGCSVRLVQYYNP